MRPETERAARAMLDRARARTAARALEAIRRRHLTAGTSCLAIDWHGTDEISRPATPKAPECNQPKGAIP